MSRGREQRRREIVATGMKIADRDGLEAVSMRRIAAELEVGTMSLYSYVASKDELLALMADAIGHEILLDEVPEDWREGIRAIARQTRAMMLRHPWVMTIHEGPPPEIPTSFLRHMDQSLQVLSGLDLDLQTKALVLRAVDALTQGATLDDHEEEHGHGLDLDVEALREAVDREGLTHLAEGIDQLRRHVSAFEYGIELLIAGIEATVKPKRAASRSRAARPRPRRRG